MKAWLRVLPLVVACAATACVQILGDFETKKQGGDGDDGDPEYGNCSECVHEECSVEVQACLDNAECVAIDTCFGQGGEYCYEDHPYGQADYDVLSACLCDSCSKDLCGC